MNYEICSDENLLLMSRSQNADAYYALTKRYFDKRVYLCHLASVALSKMFNSWDLNHTFYQTFNACVKSFSLGDGNFRSYLVKSLKYSLIREAEKLRLFKTPPTVSLDYETAGGHLHDVVPASGEADPRMYVTYLEEANRFGKLKEDIEDEVLQVARLKIDGLKFVEIAKILSITPKKASKDYKIYEKLVNGIVFGGSKIN